MRRSLVTRLIALEDRRFERDWRALARADGLTPDETEGMVADMRREIDRWRAGLRPSTLDDILTRHADDLGLTGEERAAFIADAKREIEAREAAQAAGTAEP